MCRHRISAVRLPSFLNARKKEGAPQHALNTLVISFPTCLGRRFELPPFRYGEGVPLESPSGFGCIEQPPPREVFEQAAVQRVHGQHAAVRVQMRHAAAPALVALLHLLGGHDAIGDHAGHLLELAALPRYGVSARLHDYAARLRVEDTLLQPREPARELYHAGLARVQLYAQLGALAPYQQQAYLQVLLALVYEVEVVHVPPVRLGAQHLGHVVVDAVGVCHRAYLVRLAAQPQAHLALRVNQAVLKVDYSRIEQRGSHLLLDGAVRYAGEVVGKVAEQYVAIAAVPPPVVGQVALEQLQGVVGAAPLYVRGVGGYESGDYGGNERVLCQGLLYHALGEVYGADMAQLSSLPQVESYEATAYVAPLQKVAAGQDGVAQVASHVPLRGRLPHDAPRGLLRCLAQAVEVGHGIKRARLDALGLGLRALLLAALAACSPSLL